MPTYSINAGITSKAIKIDRDSIISVNAADALVQYTDQAASAIDNNVATWQTMTLISSSAYVTDDVYVRIVSTSAVVLTVDSNPSAEKLKYYRADYRGSSSITATSATYTGAASTLTSVTVQAAIDELAGKAAVYSDSYGVITDDATDNITAINNWITAAEAIRALGRPVTMYLRPSGSTSIYARTSGRHQIHSDINLIIQGVRLAPTGVGGTDDTAPLLTYGSSATNGGRGIIWGFEAYNRVSNHFNLNSNYCALRIINGTEACHYIKFIEGFTTGVQLAANSGNCSYNTLILGRIRVSGNGVECINMSSDVGSFVAQNLILNGDVEQTSSAHDFGGGAAMLFTRAYDTGYANNSGNYWDKASIQLDASPTVWASNSATVAATAGKRIKGVLDGGEWLIKTPGTTGSTEPTLKPVTVTITSITTVAGSATISMADTTPVVDGMHIKGINPTYNFPLDTYVVSHDSTTVTLTRSALVASTTYKAVFTTPTVDNGATLIYLGPYRRTPALLRDNSTNNGIRDARAEGAVGELAISCGPYGMFPLGSSSAGGFTATFHSASNSVEKHIPFPLYLINTAYVVGDMVRLTVAAGYFLECTAAGTSRNTTEPVVTTDFLNSEGYPFTDNGTLKWVLRSVLTTADRGDIGIYTSGPNNWKISVGNPQIDMTDTFSLSDLAQRGVGSATGWMFQGLSRGSTGGIQTTPFASASFTPTRDGVRLKSASETIGTFIRTDKTKAFRVRKAFGDVSASRMYCVPLDQNLKRLTLTTNQNSYFPRVHMNGGVNAGNSISEQADTVGPDQNLLFDRHTYAAFISFALGSTPCQLNGVSFAVRPHKAERVTAPNDESMQVFNPYSSMFGYRRSMAIPTMGHFNDLGEYIGNATYAVGQPRGWTVTTAGKLAPAYANGAYIRGDIVSQSSNIYAIDGTATYANAPSGTTGLPVVDAGATSITAGHTASMTWLCAAAAFTADENS